MTRKETLLAFLVVVVGLLALLYFLQRPMVQREAALPGVQAGEGADVPVPPCAGLEGAELERCRLHAYSRQGMPQEYDKGRSPERDASSNTSRAARGSGVEGVSSAGSTLDPPTGR